MEITGTSNSKLNELKKYTITTVFQKQYISGGAVNNNGVDMINSNPNDVIIYYIDGIKYIDIISGTSSGITYNIYTPSGVTNPLNFINEPIFKNFYNSDVISNSKIKDDVFIIRQQLSVFENNYRLEFVKNLGDLLSYAGGNYFNIENNN